ncbi:hypothetical protein ABIE00_004108 [Arthrobacter sp. OAP107]
MTRGRLVPGGPKKAILRVLFPIPGKGLAELGQAGAQDPFYARFRIAFPGPRHGHLVPAAVVPSGERC